MRRPANPRVRPGRPGVHPAVVPPSAAPAASGASGPSSAASHPAPPTPVEPPLAVAASVAAPALTTRGPARRALLLAVTAVTGTVAAGAVLTRGDSVSPAASAGSGGSGNTPITSPFSDVDDEAADLEAMRWADGTGVLPALANASYSPDAVVTRGDVAMALHRFAGAPTVPLDPTPVLITDLGEDPDRATALLWLHGRGALWGDASLQVHPDADATRDFVAVMLAGLLRPALAGAGVTWAPSAAAHLAQPPEPGSVLEDVAWLVAAGMVPASLAAAAWAGEEGLTRTDLAIALHRANHVITEATR